MIPFQNPLQSVFSYEFLIDPQICQIYSDIINDAW